MDISPQMYTPSAREQMKRCFAFCLRGHANEDHHEIPCGSQTNAVIKMINRTSADEEVEGPGPQHCCWEGRVAHPFRKTACWFLKKFNISLPHDPDILLPVHTREK